MGTEFVASSLWGVIQSTLIALAALIILRLARGLSPDGRGRIALAALVLMAAVPLWTLAGGYRWSWSDSELQSPSSQTGRLASDENAAWMTMIQAPLPSLKQWMQQVDRVVQPPAAIRSPNANMLPMRGGWIDSIRGWSLRDWLVGTMWVAVGFGMLRLVAGWWTVSRLWRRSVAIDDEALVMDMVRVAKQVGVIQSMEIRQTDQLQTAAVIGWRRPRMLVPADWTTWDSAARRAILAHEMAHVRRGDFFCNAIAQLALVINYIQPLAHRLIGHLRLEQELAADAMAARVTGDRQKYLELLATLALQRPVIGRLGSAQAFLPSRHMFVRRLEMLRSMRLEQRSWLTAISYIGACAMAIIALVASGARPLTAQDRPAAPAAKVDETLAQIRRSIVTEETLFVAEIDVVRLVDSPSLVEGLKRQGLAIANLPPMGNNAPKLTEIERVVVVGELEMVTTPESPNNLMVVFMQLRAESTWSPDGISTAIADRSFVINPDVALRTKHRERFMAATKGDSPLASLDKFADSPVRLWWNGAGLGNKLKGMPLAPAVEPFAPLILSTRQTLLSLNIEPAMAVEGWVETENGIGVKNGLVAGQQMLIQLAQRAPGQFPPGNEVTVIVDLIQKMAIPSLTEMKIVEEANGVHLTIESPIETVVVAEAILGPAIKKAVEAAGRAFVANNLRQLVLALHNYASVYGHFPTASVASKSGHPRSWRVELLPFLDQVNLYNQYRKDEPWDSEANLKVLKQMPAVFKMVEITSNDEAVKGLVRPEDAPYENCLTPYQATPALQGVEGGVGLKFDAFTDGLSNTVIIVERGTGVPWTKPEDLPVDKIMEDMLRNDVMQVAFADGSVRAISETIDLKVLDALFSRDGGEVVSVNMIDRPQVPPADATKPASP
jgi:beta-lactamase regulating signal transducer with metallopeptidase domain